MDPQRTLESLFAWSPHKEATYGAVMADAKFTHATWLEGFEPPDLVKQFRSDANQAWRGTEFPTFRVQQRQGVSYPINVPLSAQLMAMIAGFSMGKVVSVETEAGPPAAYTHLITLQDPLIDGKQMPSTEQWFKAAADLGLKVKGAVCSSFSVAYARGNPNITLNSQWVGSGDYVNADLADVPALDAESLLGLLFEKDMVIKLGTPGSEGDISDRVAAVSIEIAGGAANTAWDYYPGTGLYAGRKLMGGRSVVPQLTLLAKETDDILTLLMGDTEQGLRVTWTGDTITGGEKFKVDIYIPSVHLTAAKLGEQEGYVVWQLAPGAEGVFKKMATKTITASPTGAVRASNVVTITTSTVHGAQQGDHVTVAGVTNTSFNGRFLIASVPTTATFTYAQTAADGTSGAGTANIETAVVRVTVENKEAAYVTVGA